MSGKMYIILKGLYLCKIIFTTTIFACIPKLQAVSVITCITTIKSAARGAVLINAKWILVTLIIQCDNLGHRKYILCFFLPTTRF